MCGIIGYTGPKAVAPILLDGLKRLEYRGYDSAGLAVISDERLYEVKAVGKVRNPAGSPSSTTVSSRTIRSSGRTC